MPFLGAALLIGAACAGQAKPEGWAKPVLDGSTLYVSLEHGKIGAYNVDDPTRTVWSSQFPGGEERPPLVVQNGKNLDTPKTDTIKFEGLYGNPVLDGDSLFLTAYSGHVIALNKQNGRALWVAQLPGRMVAGVLVSGDTVIAGTTRGQVYALDKQSGRVRWDRKAGKEIWSAPVTAGSSIIVATMDGELTAYSAGGDQQWRAKLTDSAIAATPTVEGNRLYVGAADKRLYAVDAGNGAVIWRSTTLDNWLWSQATVEGDAVYVASLGGDLHAFAKDGSGEVGPRWSRALGTLIRSRPVVVGDAIVAADQRGQLYVLQKASGEPVDGGQASVQVSGNLFADLLSTRTAVYAMAEESRGDGHVYQLDPQTRAVRVLDFKP